MVGERKRIKKGGGRKGSKRGGGEWGGEMGEGGGGLAKSVSILWTLGIVLLVIGAILAFVGFGGREIGDARYCTERLMAGRS